MNFYSIHDQIDIIIDTKIGKPLLNAIDFQIGHFKINDKSKLVAPKKIFVKPYIDFHKDSSQVFKIFHLTQALQGQCFNSPEECIAVEKISNGFIIYSSSPNLLINLYIQLLLIGNGYSMVHAAAVLDDKDRVVLLPGAGGVGKTALLGHLVKEHGCRFMGDDIVILGDQGNCLSFPRAFVLKEYHRSVYPDVFQKLKIKNSSGYALKRFIIENAPFVGITKKILRWQKIYHTVAHSINMVPYLAEVPVENIFGPNVLAASGNINKIIFLERYEGTEFQLEEITEQALCARMFAIIHHEWVSEMRQLFTIGAMEIVNLPSYFQKVSEIIKSGIMGKSSCVLSIPNNARPVDLMNSLIKFSLL